MPKIIKNNWIVTIVTVALVVGVLGIISFSRAAFNPQINYQGKLTNASNVAVADGNKCMKFRLMDDPTAGTELWSEEWKAATSYVVSTSGLFSVMLGTNNSNISNVNFNQTLYLDVQFDPGCDNVYEEIFLPRKVIGAVPAAFEAGKLGGYTWASPGAIGGIGANTGTFSTLTATSTGSALTISGAGANINFTGAGLAQILTASNQHLALMPGGNLGIGTTSPYSKLSVWGTNTGATSLFELTNSASSTIMTALNNGRIGIGTTSPYALLSVTGQIVGEYFTATSTSATSTFPYLTATQSYLGTVVGGTWQGTAISNVYGGTGQNSSTWTGFASLSAGTWSASTTLSSAYGGTQQNSSGWNGIAAIDNGVWSASSTLTVYRGGTGATSPSQPMASYMAMVQEQYK